MIRTLMKSSMNKIVTTGSMSAAIQMFQLRADAFGARKGWAVKVENGLEMDEFDEANPIYLVSINDEGKVVGTLRFLPTNGPTMLGHIFWKYFPDCPDYDDPKIWECTRLATARGTASEWKTPSGQCRATAELMLGGCKVAMEYGVEKIIGVYDQPMKMIYNRMGWEPSLISEETIGGKPIYLGCWYPHIQNLQAIEKKTGLKYINVERY